MGWSFQRGPVAAKCEDSQCETDETGVKSQRARLTGVELLDLVNYLCLVEVEEDVSAAPDADMYKELSDRSRGK